MNIAPKEAWDEMATHLIRGKMVENGVSYSGLSKLLLEIGIDAAAHNLNKTINQGRFKFVFFIQCMRAMGLKDAHLSFDFLDKKAPGSSP